MSIKSSLKLAPFSHRPGTALLIPFTTWRVKIFPAKLVFHNLAGAGDEELSLPIEGPVKKFTITLNLEKGRVEVFGHGKKGYFAYQLTGEGILWRKGEEIPLPFLKPAPLIPTPLRLSFGVAKKADWDQVISRMEMKEIFPFWVKLASFIPEVPFPQRRWGALQLFPHFDQVFQGGFEGILSPTLVDLNYLGLFPEEEIPKDVSPISLLHEGSRAIKELFFHLSGDEITLLPHLPKGFDAGKITGISLQGGGLLDLEWSKKRLKKVVIHSKEAKELRLHLPRGINRFRVRKNLRSSGEVHKAASPLMLKASQILYLDRFSSK